MDITYLNVVLFSYFYSSRYSTILVVSHLKEWASDDENTGLAQRNILHEFLIETQILQRKDSTISMAGGSATGTEGFWMKRASEYC